MSKPNNFISKTFVSVCPVNHIHTKIENLIMVHYFNDLLYHSHSNWNILLRFDKKSCQYDTLYALKVNEV